MNSKIQLSSTRSSRNAVRGFTLLEIMVALVLGLLLSIGIISLFLTTSRTSSLQDGLARLQENGRYAVGRIESDLRMGGAQYCSNRSGSSVAGAVAPLWPGRAPQVFAANLALQDAGGNNASVDPSTGQLTNALATSAYALSPRFFVQGYSCASGTCTPAVPSGAGQIPAAGLSDGSRVPSSDVLTVRYQRGTGWPMIVDGNCVSGGSLTISPQTGDDPVNFSSGASLAVVSDCQNPSILPISAAAGNVLTIGSMLPGTPTCTASALRDIRVFNLSEDFVTVSYYLAFRADQNPDANTNSPAPARLIPTLMRRENGVSAELVQGVDRLDFRFGVQDNGGNTRYLTAAEVQSGLGGAITCPPKPEGVAPLGANEPGCLWRAVRSVEAHLLMNTVDEVHGLDPTSRSYRYSFDATGADTTYSVDQTALPSGLALGDMLRREFVAQTSNRNYNP